MCVRTLFFCLFLLLACSLFYDLMQCNAMRVCVRLLLCLMGVKKNISHLLNGSAWVNESEFFWDCVAKRKLWMCALKCIFADTFDCRNLFMMPNHSKASEQESIWNKGHTLLNHAKASSVQCCASTHRTWPFLLLFKYGARFPVVDK